MEVAFSMDRLQNLTDQKMPRFFLGKVYLDRLQLAIKKRPDMDCRNPLNGKGKRPEVIYILEDKSYKGKRRIGTGLFFSELGKPASGVRRKLCRDLILKLLFFEEGLNDRN